MIQFTGDEIRKIRERGAKNTGMIDRLKRQTETLMREPALIPKDGIGNWTLYYYCPECSVQLEIDRHSADKHRCPVCGKIYGGEPYDGAWWGFMHMENYNGAFALGTLYLLTGDIKYGRKAADILCNYADYYEGYEVHGSIPYNDPGKACAQTLDDAVLLRTFAMTYDLVEALMEPQEREAVRDHFLIPGAVFLMEHRHRQLHNHEVIINSAIAVIGLILKKEDYIQSAVYEPYGLLYQLENGMQRNGVWFEGSFGYHFYALTSFFAYEKFALHTEHSHINHPNYRKMMETPAYYMGAEGWLPMMNDTSYGHFETCFYLYEFAYREIGGAVMAAMLNEFYKIHVRDNLEALLYGVDELPKGERLNGDYHTPEGQSGHTVLHGPEGRFLLLKHDTYGGEHDHYDRLGLSFSAYGKRISQDFGTTGYGAVLHYDYYKNTGAHNTVVIGEENQPPAAARLVSYENRNGIIYVEAVCDFREPYQMPDTFTIPQWSEENYRNVCMKRKIAWAGEWFAELFFVEGVDDQQSTDWVMHISGEPEDREPGKPVMNFSAKKPYKYLEHVEQKEKENLAVNRYEEDGIHTDLYSFVPEGAVITARGPDNPSYKKVNYVIERRYAASSLYLHVVETYKGTKNIKRVNFIETGRGKAVIEVEDQSGIRTIVF